MAHTIYLDLECSLMKHDTCANNPNNSYTEKVTTHKPCCYDLNIVKSYDENISTYYRGKDCLSHMCKNLRDHVTKLATIKKKPLITDDEQLNHERSKKFHICKTRFNTDENSKHYNNYRNVIDHDHYTGNIEVRLIAYVN